MAIEKNFYQDFTERRENKYKPITAKNTVDNSNGIMYNENKKSTPSITPVTDFASKWKEDNKDLFKYAGDSAKKSVEKGLKEAPDYMQDADEGTSFKNVQTASVKRHLANDANDEKLLNASIMEMIGHLSKDNKEDYLKHSQPLQKYIDVKDEFDFKHNNYTTTENVDKTPDENVRMLQRELNEAGYTDKFGQKLKEDGIYAGKTAYADDSKKADTENTSQRFGNRANLPSRRQPVNMNGTYSTTNDKTKPFSKDNLTFEEQIKIGRYVYGDSFNPYIHSLNISDDGMVATYPVTANASGPMGPVYEYVNDILNKVNNAKEQIETKVKTFFDEYVPYYSFKNGDIKLSDSGKLADEDKEKNKIKKTMLKCLSANWYGANDNTSAQEDIHNMAESFRKYDDNSFNRIVLLNNSDGASGAGHNAIMLINKDNKGLVFSFYSSNPNFTKAILNEAEVRFGVLESKEVNDLLNEKTKSELKLIASDNSVVKETYDRVICYDLTTTGYNVYNAAVALYDCPGYYSLAARHCDDITIELLKEAGINIQKIILPNGTYFIYNTIDNLKEVLKKEN